MTVELRECDRAVAGARRGDCGRGDRALRRLLVERVQVSADDLVPERQVLACNGIPVPLRPTATAGRTVGGRAIPGVAAVVGAAPDLGVHSPLVFDVVDRPTPARWAASPIT